MLYNNKKAVSGGVFMEVCVLDRLRKTSLAQWQALLEKVGLTPDEALERWCLVYEGATLVATGGRSGNLLKCIAVDPEHQGEDLTATVLTALRQDAFAAGHRHLFLYTKPGNEYLFTDLFFYPVAKTGDVLLMESEKDGIRKFLDSLPTGRNSGAIVMNCDPFTLGHQYLIETATRECSHLFVFVLSEDRGHFPAADRLAMVKAGTAHLPNVTVLPTGPYLISAATFPTYFLKNRDRAGAVQCQLDIQIFTQYFAPHFGITRRFVGEEPLSPMTGLYNAALAEALPKAGIRLTVIPRLCIGGTPVSASAVRARLAHQEEIRDLVPATTYQYLQPE